MALTTWTNGDNDRDVSAVGNYSAGVPGDGDTVVFDGLETGYGGDGNCDGLPNNGALNAAHTINTQWDAEYDNLSVFGGDVPFDELLGGAKTGVIALNGHTSTISPWGSVANEFTLATVAATDRLDLSVDAFAGDVELNGGKLVLRSSTSLDGDVSAITDSEMDWNGLSLTGSFDAGGHAITHLSVSGALLVCDNAANLDLGSDVPLLAIEINAGGNTVEATRALVVGDFTLTGGTYDDGGFDHNINGNILIPGGTFTNSGLWTMAGTGNLGIAVGSSLANLKLESGADVTITTTLTRIVNSFDAVSGSSLDINSNTFRILYSGAGGTDKLHCEATVTDSGGGGLIHIYKESSATNALIVDFGNVKTQVTGYRDKTWAQTAAWTCGDLTIYDEDTSGSYAHTFTMSGAAFTASAITLGHATLDSSGILNLPDIANIGGVAAGSDANTGNELNCGAGSFNVSDEINGNSLGTNPMTITATGANFHGTGASSEIKEATVTGILHCWGMVDGGNNNTGVAHESSIGPGANVGTGIGIMA